MMDHNGRIVGSGMSRPIMITDDHKTSTANKPAEMISSFAALDHPDWSQVGGVLNEISPISDNRAPSRRKKELLTGTNKRAKPYDASAKPIRVSREGSVSSVPSPSTSYSPLPTTRASTPFSTLQNVITPEQQIPSHPPSLQEEAPGSETSSSDAIGTPLDHHSDVNMPEVEYGHDICEPIPPTTTLIHPSNLIMSALPRSMPFMYFDPSQASQQMQVQAPIIHRLIPNAGPTHGGIEVTILGANFHPAIQLNCIFGDVAASSTQRWSDNTLVCMLPPRAMPGVVAVWFEGFPKTTDDQALSPPSLFTYSDESDRALSVFPLTFSRVILIIWHRMELALQVVGLKMTGKIEDAKNVAMRIVGSAGNDSNDPNHNNNGMMQLSLSPATSSLSFVRSGNNSGFERRIIDLLSIIDTPIDEPASRSVSIPDAISYQSASGQTLLHLAVFLELPVLTRFLVSHGADLDARDRNGFTPLHFAALTQTTSCTSILLQAGADVEIVNALGKTAEEISITGPFEKPAYSTDDSDEDWSEDEDAELGDAEEEADVPIRRNQKKRISRHPSRLSVLQSGRGTPKRSLDVSRAATPPPALPQPNDEKLKEKDDSDTADAKRAASFMEKMIQRTLAQIPATHGIIPNMPQLPLPHLPNLPDLPAVPWGSLPQIPMVFPVFVPMMPNWPSFRGEHATDSAGQRIPAEGDDTTRNMGAAALRAAQEWRATWEKWVALAVASTAGQQTEDLPPPIYTPRAGEDEVTKIPAGQENIELPEAVPSSSSREPRPVGYDSTPVPDQVVESFGYQPPAKETQNLQKKRKIIFLIIFFGLDITSILTSYFLR